MKKLYALWVSLVSRLQSQFLLIIRLYWGWQFCQTGWGKLTHLDKTASFFASLNIPAPKLNAIMAGGTECFGGLLLMIGLGSRIITVPLIFTMIVAYLTAESDAAHAIFSNPDKFVTATPFLFMLTAIIVLIFGSGHFSLDAVIARVRDEKKSPVAPLTLSQIAFSYKGRISRGTFWCALESLFIVSLIILLTTGALSNSFYLPGVAVAIVCREVWLLLAVWVMLALQVKRLHDLGITGWAVLFSFIPFINVLILIALGIIPGKSEANTYGANPLFVSE